LQRAPRFSSHRRTHATTRRIKNDLERPRFRQLCKHFAAGSSSRLRDHVSRFHSPMSSPSYRGNRRRSQSSESPLLNCPKFPMASVYTSTSCGYILQGSCWLEICPSDRLHHVCPARLPTTGDTKCCISPEGIPRNLPHDRRFNVRSSRRRTATIWALTRPDPRLSFYHLVSSMPIHVGHSTGGGEPCAYVARTRPRSGCPSSWLISARCLHSCLRRRYPGGLPDRRARGLRRQLAATCRSSTSISRAVRCYCINRHGRGGFTSGDLVMVAPWHEGSAQGPLEGIQVLLGNRDFHADLNKYQRCRHRLAWWR